MSVKEYFIDKHRKVVFVNENNYTMLIADLYPCQIEGFENIDKVVEIDKIKIILSKIVVSKPFDDGMIEILCTNSAKCFSVSLILRLSHLDQQEFEEIMKKMKDILSQYENCLQQKYSF